MTKPKPIKVKIKSFQSIDDIEFKISGFTCISGKTNIGKSAIIRSISGAFLNSPVGGLVRKGERFCSVEIMSDEWGFKWEKGEKGVNRYWMPDNDKPLDKVGQGQIENVSVMGFGFVKVGSESVYPWLAPQFKPLFLMDQSGPSITDFISEISRLKTLQNAIIINTRRKRRALDQVKTKENDVIELQTKKAKFKDIDSMLKIKEELKDQIDSIENYRVKVLKGKELLDKIKNTEKKVSIFSEFTKVKIPDSDFDDPILKVKNMQQIYYALEREAKRIIRYKEVKKLQIPDEDILVELENLIKCNMIFKRAQRIEKQINTLSSPVVVPDTEEFPSELVKAQKILVHMSELQAEEGALAFRLVEVEIDKIDVCPICRRPISQVPLHQADHLSES
jgi:hypothetical protein